MRKKVDLVTCDRCKACQVLDNGSTVIFNNVSVTAWLIGSPADPTESDLCASCSEVMMKEMKLIGVMMIRNNARPAVEQGPLFVVKPTVA